MGRAGGAAGLPVRAVALDDGGDFFGRDTVQVQFAAAFDRPRLRRWEGLSGLHRGEARAAPVTLRRNRPWRRR
jgi:hypothetical protein